MRDGPAIPKRASCRADSLCEFYALVTEQPRLPTAAIARHRALRLRAAPQIALDTLLAISSTSSRESRTRNPSTNTNFSWRAAAQGSVIVGSNSRCGRQVASATHKGHPDLNSKHSELRSL